MEENKKITPKVETLSGDMVKILEHPEEGLIKNLINQEEAHEEEKRNFSPDTGKNKVMLFVSVFLFLIAVGGLVYFALNRESLVVEVSPQFTPLIYTDENVLIPTDGLKKDAIEDAVFARTTLTQTEEGEVEGIYLTEGGQALGLRALIKRLGATLVFDKTNQNFIDDNYLIGVVNRETTNPFILIKIRSHTDVFETMRKWEQKIFLDLHGFFGVPISPETSYLLTKDFVDGIMQNQNARILYDNSGGIVMAYIYGDQNSLIITANESTTREVIMRLASSRIKK